MQTTEPQTGPARKPDWPMIRVAYESGAISDRALAREHGLSDTAIRKRAKAEKWQKASRPDLMHRGNPSQRAAAEASANSPPREVRQPSPAMTPDQIIDRGRGLAVRLLDELETTTAYVGELEEMILTETEDDRDGRRRHAMQKAIDLPSRAAVLKNLALAAKTFAEAMPGKKEERADAAKKVGVGRFETPAAPKLVVNNR